MNPLVSSPVPLRAWIVVRRGEAASKCTIRPLRGTPGLEFLRYPLAAPCDFPGALLLAPGAAFARGPHRGPPPPRRHP